MRRPKGNGRGHKWQLDEARRKRVRGMLSNGYTVAEMARSLCVSESTLAERLREAGLHPDQRAADPVRSAAVGEPAREREGAA